MFVLVLDSLNGSLIVPRFCFCYIHLRLVLLHQLHFLELQFAQEALMVRFPAFVHRVSILSQVLLKLLLQPFKFFQRANFSDLKLFVCVPCHKVLRRSFFLCRYLGDNLFVLLLLLFCQLPASLLVRRQNPFFRFLSVMALRQLFF